MSARDDRMSGTSVQVPTPIPDVPLPESNDPAVVSQWARKVMDSFGLHDWAFAFDNARRRLGACHYGDCRITMSRHFVRLNGGSELRETLLHEVAHALVGPGHGHGRVWQAMARRVGCRPVRCGRAEMPAGNVAATCGCCARVFRRHRRPSAGVRHWCRRCGPERGLLTWGGPS
jgi:predicted SprT family Zn-dependent metalloprotease